MEIAVIRLHSLTFGPFAEVEPLNPAFLVGHPKLRLIVDTEAIPAVAASEILREIQETFPGLTRHRCQIRAVDNPPVAGGIVLLEGEPSANLAHLLEHLVLEFLSTLDHVPRRSGVTCAYASPPERNDIFVECAESESGSIASLLAIEAVNAVLAGNAPMPLYPDALRSAAAILEPSASRSVSPSKLVRASGISPDRAGAVLELYSSLRIAEREDYTMNFSGEPHYRIAGPVRTAEQADSRGTGR